MYVVTMIKLCPVKQQGMDVDLQYLQYDCLTGKKL